MTPTRIRTIIMGAAGRDFHNFNTHFRNNLTYDVVAFSATHIPTSISESTLQNLLAV